MKTILFIAPYSGIAGSELFIYNMLLAIDKSKYICCLYSENKSDLFLRLPDNIHVYYRKKSFLYYIKLLFRFLSNVLSFRFKISKHEQHEICIRQIQSQCQADLWIINTIKPAYAQKLARELGVKCITFIHELPSAFSMIKYHDLENIINYSDEIWCCSNSLKKQLNYIKLPHIRVQHAIQQFSHALDMNKINTIKTELNIMNSDFICVGTGTILPNKSPDFFLKIASLLKDTDIKFIWIGRKKDSGYYCFLEKTIEHLNLKNVYLVGEQFLHYNEYLSLANLFLLTSYNESFSLVTLEALMSGIPVLAYDCFGVSDLVSDKNGIIMNTRDESEWVAEILKIKNGTISYEPYTVKDSVSNYSYEVQQDELHNKLNTIFSK
jgi:glycosyltransferase involved in cell wall biosynthesis